MVVTILAMSLDMNAFIHVNSAYLRQCSIGFGPSAVVYAATLLGPHELPTVRELFKVEMTITSFFVCPTVVPLNLPALNSTSFDVGKFPQQSQLSY